MGFDGAADAFSRLARLGQHILRQFLVGEIDRRFRPGQRLQQFGAPAFVKRS